MANETALPPGAALALALSKTQNALRSVGKDRDVEVKSEKGRYSFRYATLAAIWDVIRKPCADNGLAIVQFPTVDLDGRRVSVETRVMHVSGESLVNVCVLPCLRQDPQGIGAVITYARRYSLSALLGVTQDDENEEEILSQAHAEHRAPPTSTQKPAQQQPKAAPEPQKQASEPALGEADLHQQMACCGTIAELSSVAVLVKKSNFPADARERLLKSYQKRADELKPKGAK